MALVSVIALAMTGTGANAAAATVQRVEVNSYLFDACTNELVNVTGTYEQVAQSFLLPGGQIHFVLHTTEHYVGVGQTSGDEYVLNVELNFQWNFAADFDGEQTLTASYRGVGKGSVLDLTRHTTAHLTIVDGVPIVNVQKIWFTCT
jgi:hypothetical protein